MDSFKRGNSNVCACVCQSFRSSSFLEHVRLVIPIQDFRSCTHGIHWNSIILFDTLRPRFVFGIKANKGGKVNTEKLLGILICIDDPFLSLQVWEGKCKLIKLKLPMVFM